MLTFPPDCSYSPEQRRLAELFAERMARLGQTEAEAGRDLKPTYTAGALSSFLSGTYGASPANLCKAIRARLEADAREAAAVKLPDFADTSIVRSIHAYLRTRRDGHLMGYVCGAPGLGRSVAVARFADANENVILVACHPKITPMGLLRAIAAPLGIVPARSYAALREALVAALKNLPGGLILIDEADRMALDVADSARDLWDASRCGQVWSGTARLIQYLDAHPDSLAGQVRRRLGDILRLPGLDPNDVAAILAQYTDWPEPLRSLAAAGARGNTDRLCQAVRAARTVAAGAVPTRKHIEDAFRALD